MVPYRTWRQFSKFLHAFKNPHLCIKPQYYQQSLRHCTIATSEIGEQLERSAGVYASDLNLWCGDSRIELNGVAKDPISFHYVWLRFHCRCDECFNHKMQQRILTILDITQLPKPTECFLDGNHLVATWADGHKSRFELSWLANASQKAFVDRFQDATKNRHLWQGQETNVARVPFKDFVANKSAKKKVLQSLLDYGVAFVDQVNPTLEATEDTVRALAPVQHTFFGGMWEFGVPEEGGFQVHEDTAYTSIYLGPHTDNSYFTESSGLQVFHCLSPPSAGGETILVDGFAAAERLKATHPRLYDILVSTVVPFVYDEPGEHMVNLGAVLDLHPLTRTLQQIRYNPYDLARLSTMRPSEAVCWLDAWRRLSLEIASPAAPWHLALRPGTVLFIDNWRVLHGRQEFQGKRHMAGCYIARSDFLSAARVSGALADYV